MKATKNPYQNPKDRLGVKKVPLHLIPESALIHEAMAMWTGAVSYGAFNWRTRKVVASIYIAACHRHMAAWFDGGETFASDGVTHLGHARACLGIILDAESLEMLVDDRPPPGATGALLAAYSAMISSVTPQLVLDENGLGDRDQVDWVQAHAAYYDALEQETGKKLNDELYDSLDG